MKDLKKCKDCIYNDSIECEMNNPDASYFPSEIFKWLKKSICEMTDFESMKYDPRMAEILSTTLFKYFVNRKKPLYSKGKFNVIYNGTHVSLIRAPKIDTEKKGFVAFSIRHPNTNKKIHKFIDKSMANEFKKILDDLDIEYYSLDLCD